MFQQGCQKGIMELMNVQSDLQALRKLYGLLQSSLDSHVQEWINEILDERAKLVLKNLLDDATKKALETRTKMIATAQSDCYSKEEQLNMESKLVSPFSPDNKNIESSQYGGIQNLGKCSNKLPSNRNKSCRGCEQRGMKQQQIRSTKTTRSKLVYGTQPQQQYGNKLKSNQRARGKRINEILGGNLVSAAASAFSSNSAKPGLHSGYNLCGQKKSDNVTSNFSRDVNKAIRRIESGILDLHKDRGNAVENPNPKPIRLAAEGQISNRLLGSKQAQAQAIGLRLPLPVHKQGAIRKKKKQPAPVVAHTAAAVCVSHKLKPPSRRQPILRPTLMETDCSKSSRELAESDETSINIDTSSSWKTNTSDNYSDSDLVKSYPKKFAYWGSKSSESSSDSSSRETSNSSTGSGVQTNKYRLYYHKAVSNNPEEHTAIGRLRRFKNKLGFIFHHHHHHHHHHHYSKVSRHTNNVPDIITGKHRNKNICVKQAAIVDEYSRKSTETNIMQYNKRQQQANYFRKLVKGLMRRHVGQHSKKQNNGRRNLHWWQKFKRNGGVKLRNKRGRLGLKRTNLQRIRTIKMK